MRIFENAGLGDVQRNRHFFSGDVDWTNLLDDGENSLKIGRATGLKEFYAFFFRWRNPHGFLYSAYFYSKKQGQSSVTWGTQLGD